MDYVAQTPTADNGPIAAALDYARRGWAVFPCDGKKPRTSRGFHDASTDEKQIRSWWEAAHPGANIGLACNGDVWALDIDGPIGAASLNELEAIHGSLPATVTNLTGGGGRHFLFKSGNSPIKNAAGVRPGLDTRSDGYVVLPPSVHPDTGAAYKWEDGRGPDDIEVADAPAWLVDMVRKQDAHGPVTVTTHPTPDRELTADQVRDMLSYIHPDCSYDDWLQIGMGLHAGGYPVQVWDNWSRDGAKYQAGDCYKRWKGFKPGAVTFGTVWHLAEQGGWSVESLRPTPTGPHPAAGFLAKVRGKKGRLKHQPSSTAAPKFPDECLIAPGLVGRIADWINQTALIAQPRLALAVTIAVLGAVYGRRYKMAGTDTRTNVLIVGVAPTGGGKDHPRKAAKSLLSKSGLSGLTGGDHIASGPAIMTMLFKQPSVVCLLDEFGLFLQAISNKNAPAYLRDIAKTIMEVFSSAGSVALGTQYASVETERRDVVDPSLSIFGTTTPGTFEDAVSSADVASGLLNRLLIVCGNPDARLPSIDFSEGRSSVSDPPRELVEAVRAAYAVKAQPSGNLAAVVTNSPGAIHHDLISVPVSADAATALNAVVERQERQRTNKADPARDMWCRLFENVCKLSIIAAISEDPVYPRVDVGHVAWAASFVTWCVESAAHMVRTRVADSPRDKLAKDILSFIAEAGSTVSKAVLTKKFQRVASREREDVLRDLIGSGQITQEITKADGARMPTTTYRVAEGDPSDVQDFTTSCISPFPGGSK
jgi:hypothetical protein